MSESEFDLKFWLDSIIPQVETMDYITSDPVQFMHCFDSKTDKEIAGFFAAIMAWGNRKIVNAKVSELLDRMNGQPTDFIINFSENKVKALQGFKHRTFKEIDLYWICEGLKCVYHSYGDLEGFWQQLRLNSTSEHFVQDFHFYFFNLIPEAPQRTRKHIADGRKGSTCKRLFLFLRWAVRKNSAVDAGIYNSIDASELMIPFDVHVARMSRKLGLIQRKQDDWKSLMELHIKLKQFDSTDPSKYDYALFGLGIQPELLYSFPNK